MNKKLKGGERIQYRNNTMNTMNNYWDYMHNAISQNDINQLRKINRTDLNFWNKIDSKGRNLISIACIDGANKILKFLLNINIDPNKLDIYRFTPLMNAILNERVECIKILLASPKININKEGQYNNTALIYCSNSNNITILSLLLQRKDIDLNKINQNGDSALLILVRKNLVNCVSLLLDQNNVDLFVKNNKGEDCMSYNNASSNLIQAYIMNIIGDYNAFKKYFKDKGYTLDSFEYFIRNILGNNKFIKESLLRTKEDFKRFVDSFIESYLPLIGRNFTKNNLNILNSYSKFIEILYMSITNNNSNNSLNYLTSTINENYTIFNKILKNKNKQPQPVSPLAIRQPSSPPVRQPQPVFPLAIRQPSPQPRPVSPLVIRQPSPQPRPVSPLAIRQPSPQPRPVSPLVIRQPSPQPVRQPSPQPVRQPSQQPVRQPSPQPIRQQVSPQPIRQQVSPQPIRQQLSPQRIRQQLSPQQTKIYSNTYPQTKKKYTRYKNFETNFSSTLNKSMKISKLEKLVNSYNSLINPFPEGLNKNKSNAIKKVRSQISFLKSDRRLNERSKQKLDDLEKKVKLIR